MLKTSLIIVETVAKLETVRLSKFKCKGVSVSPTWY